MNAPEPSSSESAGTSRLPYGVAPSGYRFPEELALGPVVLQVADLERSAAFYKGILGLRTLTAAPGQEVLAASGDELPLVELRERPGARAVPPRGRLGLFHFAILLPDRAALGRLVRHLAETGVRAGASDHLVSEALYLQDPDGLGIEVYADRPRSEWRYEQRQLVMATEPLDLDDLVRAAGSERWAGMPPGTRIGHVHLHVGEIDTAAHFYHDALGFDRTVWNYPGALFLSAGGYHHHLGVNTWAAGAPPAAEEDARLIEWQILLPAPGDLDQVAASLERNRYRAERMEGSGILARDPWGTAVRITAQSAPPGS